MDSWRYDSLGGTQWELLDRDGRSRRRGRYLRVIAICDPRAQNHDRSASPDFERARGCLNAGSKELCLV